MDTKPGDSLPENRGVEIQIKDRGALRVEYHIADRNAWSRKEQPPEPEVTLNALEAFDSEARMAAALIERWGCAAASPDGEDSAGRAKLRKLTPTELVNEACETAKIALEEFRRRGWMLKLPTRAEAVKLIEERRAAAESSRAPVKDAA